MKFLCLLLGALGILTTLPLAVAGEIADLGKRAEGFAAASKFEEAALALDAAQDQLWAQSPLMFRRTLFTASTPVGLGIYDLRENNVFKRGETIIIYTEPMGYGYGRDGQLYVIELGLSYVIKDSSGKEVASQSDFGDLKLRSRFRNKEFMATVNYDFSGLPPGDYKLTTIIHDKPTGKKGEFTLPLTLTD